MLLPNLDKILIIRTDRMGDLVLTSPVFKALRKTYPAAKISVMVLPTTVDLVEGNPYIDQVMVDWRASTHKGLLGFLCLSREIRQGGFDAAVILHTKRRYNLACFLAGVPLRVGFKNAKFGGLLTRPLKDIRVDSQMHEAQLCLEVLKTIGVESAPLDLFVPMNREAEHWAMGWLKDHQLSPGNMIILHPGARDHSKIWPMHNFVKLIESLRQRYTCGIVLIGGAETAPISQEIVKRCSKSVINVTGQLNLAQTISLLRRCRLLISNDSGPMHLGAGVGVFTIGLFLRNQPGISPERWRPLGPRSFMLFNKPGEEIVLDKDGKVVGGRLDSITVESVLDLTESIFAKNNQSMFYW